MTNLPTINHYLESSASRSDKGYRILSTGKKGDVYLSFSQVLQASQRIAVHIQTLTQPGDRVALLLSPGQDFILGFYGALLSGRIAVPMYVPRRKTPETALAICADSRPALVLSSHSLATRLAPFYTEFNKALPNSNILNLEDCQEVANMAIEQLTSNVSGEDIAFLQYTSGSTSLPKGVCIRHSNVIANIKAIEQSTGFTEGDNLGCWLPPYHDMGLIGGILCPVVSHAEITLITPQAFVQRPARWMNLMSDYQCHISAGPNFAFDLAATTRTEEDARDLSLAHVKCIVSGAEPVRNETLERFYQRYSAAGLKLESLSPSYGLAESTLIATGISADHAPTSLHVAPESFSEEGMVQVDTSDRGIALSSCGKPVNGMGVKVVNQTSGLTCKENEIGEVWISGTSAAKQYWGATNENERFNKFLADTEKPPYFATGDRGFIHNDELYLCGRYKELVIVRGKNFDPVDLERTILRHANIHYTACAIFSIDAEEASLVVAVELPRISANTLKASDLVNNIQATLTRHFEISASDIVFSLEFGLPRTSSGKIQRLKSKSLYQDKTLKTLPKQFFISEDNV